MPRGGIRARRSRKVVNKVFHLQLTSLLDIFMIILVFLLVSFAVSTTNFSTFENLEMPLSKTEDQPPDSLHIVISLDGLFFENRRILNFKTTPVTADPEGPLRFELASGDLAEENRLILPLFDALMEAKGRSETLRQKSQTRDISGDPLPFEGTIAIQADKRVDYLTLRMVMYTAASAGYTTYRFLAQRNY
jgi:biopolymer transport protein ExbD